jgi:hypothetical protein
VIVRIVDLILRLAVGHGPPGADDALVEAGGENIRLRRHLPHAGEGEALHLATQGAEVGGEQVGHHVDAAVREVDRGGSVRGLQVHGGPRPDEVRHVGDVDAHLEKSL